MVESQISVSQQSTLDPSDGFRVGSDESEDLSDSCTKLKDARNYFLSSTRRLDGHSLSDSTINLLWKDFTGYRDKEDYLVVRQKNGFSDGQLYGMQLPKRGNAKYRSQKREKVHGLLEGLEQDDLALDYSEGDSTKALFLTFTYDSSRCTLREAWNSVGEEYNRSISALRQEYGQISVFRIFEAYESGYPHIHAILLFHDHEFTTFEKDGKTRIEGKRYLERIAGWHSFIDVKGVDHLGRSINYLSKYFLKDSVDIADNPGEERKAKLTLSLQWLFRKRSFALSGDFKEKLHEFIHSKSNSNKDVSYFHLFKTLEGVEYEFLTTNSGDFLEIDRTENFIALDDWIEAKIDLS